MTLLERDQRAALLAALVASHGHRGKAAKTLGWPARTFARRLATVPERELARLARAHGWPDRAAAARVARSASAAARRAGQP